MDFIALERSVTAANYDPLPVVLTEAKGVWVTDTEGRRYLDMMSAYSAVSLGHGHPRILNAMVEQASRLAVTSRAYHTDVLGPFLERLVQVSGLDMALPMNTGAEAVETAIKAARRWGYSRKKIARDRAEIIVAENNFHGRTTTIVGFSSDESYREGFGPFAGGFKLAPFGDAAAIERMITENTCAVLIEPIQGEAGIVVPPEGYLRDLRAICDRHNVLLILDEVQSGLGRTGRWFAHQHEGIRPDGLILGKALGGGVYPVSAFVATHDVMSVFNPGSHGSTFGGNALAARIGLEALAIIEEEHLVERSAEMGSLSPGSAARHAQQHREGRARPRPLGRRRGRCECGLGACRLRLASRKRRALEGHPRNGAALRTASHHHPRGDRLGDGADRAGLRPRRSLIYGDDER